jgi:hypothetical protein
MVLNEGTMICNSNKIRAAGIYVINYDLLSVNGTL